MRGCLPSEFLPFSLNSPHRKVYPTEHRENWDVSEKVCPFTRLQVCKQLHLSLKRGWSLLTKDTSLMVLLPGQTFPPKTPTLAARTNSVTRFQALNMTRLNTSGPSRTRWAVSLKRGRGGVHTLNTAQFNQSCTCTVGKIKVVLPGQTSDLLKSTSLDIFVKYSNKLA